MKNPHAQALGKLGGFARAQNLTPEQRLRASRNANLVKKKRAQLLWGNHVERNMKSEEGYHTLRQAQ